MNRDNYNTGWAIMISCSQIYGVGISRCGGSMRTYLHTQSTRTEFRYPHQIDHIQHTIMNYIFFPYERLNEQVERITWYNYVKARGHASTNTLCSEQPYNNVTAVVCGSMINLYGCRRLHNYNNADLHTYNAHICTDVVPTMIHHIFQNYYILQHH